MAIKRVLIICSVMTAYFNWAQTVTHKKLLFKNLNAITTEQPISSIVQDNSNVTWLSTFGSGIYSFDGVNFKGYNHNIYGTSTIGSNLVHFVFIDRDKQIWAGTDSGLHLYIRDTDSFEKVKFNTTNVLREHINFTCVVQEESGTFLFGTYEYGAMRYNPKTNTINRIPFEQQFKKEPIIASFAKNNAGTIVLGTNLGLFSLDNNKTKIVKADISFKTDEINIESLLFDKNDVLWIGSAMKGLFKANALTSAYTIEHKKITQKKIFTILEVGNYVYLGTENDGLIVVDKQGKVIEKYNHTDNSAKGISSNSVWSLYKDFEDRIWLGHYNSGIDVHDKFNSKFGSIERDFGDNNSLASNSVTGIDKDQSGNLWISMYGGIDIYNPNSKLISHLNGSKNDTYPGLDKKLSSENIFIDSKENVWLGTWENGIYFLDKKNGKFINYSVENTNGILKTNAIKGFAEDETGRIWIASFLKGLFYVDPRTQKIVQCESTEFANSEVSNHDIESIIIDKNNAIWLGTSGGLFKLVYDDELNIKVFNQKEKLAKASVDHPSIHRISTLYEAKNGKIYVGTDGAGLFEYDLVNDTFSSCNAIYEVHENTVKAIVQSDENTLWLSGKSGVTQIDLKAKKAQNFTIEDGLLANNFNEGAIEIDTDGLIYFGSYSGINFVDPKQTKLNTNEPKLYFTDFKLFNKSVSLNDDETPLSKSISQTNEIQLSHNQSVFTLEYVGASHTRPEKNEYAYMLEGFEDDWNYVGNTRSVTYTNLAPDDYTFKVKAANHDGVWTKTPLTLKIQVLPPWWKSQKAYLLYFLTSIGLLALIWYFIKENIRKKQIRLLTQEKRKQEKELQEAKFRFFTNISHEFRTPLTLIINPIEDLLKNSKSGFFEGTEQKLRTIKRNSDRLSRLINELMDFRKLQSNKVFLKVANIELIEQIENILSYFTEEAAHRKISLELDSKIDTLLAWVDPSMFEKIVFNILSNAFKVSPEGGRIRVAVTLANDNINETENSVVISVEDTGPGLDQREYKKIFNRFYQAGADNKAYYGSSGVGLEMVKSFVELHKGTINVKSKLNQGSTFIVSLPLGKKHFEEHQIVNDVSQLKPFYKTTNYKNASEEVIHQKEKINEEHKEKSILIVEDNDELQNYLQSELDKNFKTFTAYNGKKGLELAVQLQPDLIITDVIMPEMNGLELCESIKANMKTSHIPLLMLTSKAMVEDKIRGLDSGADAYMNKPFDMNLLQSTITQLLQSRKILFDKYHQNQKLEKPESTTTMDNHFITKALHYIHKNIEDPEMSVDQLASDLSLSRSQLYRKIKSLTGMTAIAFLRKIRLEEAKKLLASEINYNVSEVAYKVGFTSPSYFTKCYKKEFGHLPKEN